MKSCIVCMLTLIVLLAGCAKSNDPVSPSADGILKIDWETKTVGDPQNIAVTPTRVFTAENALGSSIIDRSNGNQFQHFYDNYPIKFKWVEAVSDTLVYFMQLDGSDGIYVYKFLDPNNPTLFITHTGDTSGGKKFTIQDHHGESPQHSDRDSFFWIFRNDQISAHFFYRDQPLLALMDDNLTLVSYYPPMDFITNDLITYFAVSTAGVAVYNRQSGGMIAVVDTPGSALAIKLIGNYIYVADQQFGLQVIDVTAPENATLLADSGVKLSSFARSLDGAGNYLMVGTHGNGVYLFDISDGAHPKLVDNLPKSKVGYVNAIKAYDGKFYVASRDNGVLCLSVGSE